MGRRRVAILGATGSIGTQALDVARRLPEAIEVVALAAHRSAERVAELAHKFKVRLLAMTDPEAAGRLKALLNEGVRVLAGEEALEALVVEADPDIVVVATAGLSALKATLLALGSGKRVALATKEILVEAGRLVMKEARKGELVPVDSEHSAAFQLLRAEGGAIRKLVITASGGPFRSAPKEALEGVTPEEALRHPTWRMGVKVTVDSATLMNKALEVVEAHHLFGLPPERIEVVVHPQSIVHALVELTDGAVMAHMALPDMRLPIQYALTHPGRLPSPVPLLDLTKVGRLEFEPVDYERFPCARLGHEALRAGGGKALVMSAADEVAVEAFLEGRIKFTDIARVVMEAMDSLDLPEPESPEEALEAHKIARAKALELMGG